MTLMPVDDGARYIDLTKATQFGFGDVVYYKSEHGVWARHERGRSMGVVVSETDAFKLFMAAGRFTEAEKHFTRMFEDAVALPDGAEPAPDVTSVRGRAARWSTAGALSLALLVYFMAILIGAVPRGNRIGATDLGFTLMVLLLIGILLRPQVLDNIERLEFGTLKVELRKQLRDLQGTQAQQQQELDQLRFILSILVTDSERVHLDNLSAKRTSGYRRHDSLQAELRRLRAMGLIQSKRYIGDMPQEFDLADWVELTRQGDDYLRRWRGADSQP